MNDEVQQEEEKREIMISLCKRVLELEYLARENGETPPPRPANVEREMLEHADDLKDFVPFSDDDDDDD